MVQGREQQVSPCHYHSNPIADLGSRHGVPDLIGQGDRRGIHGELRPSLPVLLEGLVDGRIAVRLEKEGRAVFRKRLAEPFLLVARHLDDVAPVLVRDLVREPLVDPLREELVHVAQKRVERLAGDERGSREGGLPESVVVDSMMVYSGNRECPRIPGSAR